MAITLSTNELKKLFTVSAALTILTFFVIVAFKVWVSGTPTGAALFQATTASISFSAIALFIVVKSKWNKPWLAWLADRPIVHGFWWGELHAIYQGVHLPPIPIAFVVKQTYVTLSIQSYTAGIAADSTIEIFDKSDKNSDVRLKYVYEMKREANAEHKSTTGYGELKLQGRGAVLSGFYWTNSPTEGAIRLEMIQRNCDHINCFESAQETFASIRRSGAT